MHHLTITAVLCALALTGCGDLPKGGAVVASGRGGLRVTADEFTARLEEQPPFVRAGYSALEKKKELLDTVVRFEVLAQEAARQGLDRDPEVIRAQRKVMVQKLVQARMQAAGPAITGGEINRYYEAHQAEYVQPKRVRLQVLEFSAAEGAPEREKQAARARLALAQVRAGQSFDEVVAALRPDATVKAPEGELDFQTREELSGRFGPQAAAELLSLPELQVSAVLEPPEGLVIARVLALQEASPRPLAQVRAQIENKLEREKRTQAYEAWVNALTAGAGVSVDERALAAIPLAPVP